MKYCTLGRTGLNVSCVSLGTGGPSRIGQSTHGDETKSHRVIHRALDLGINLVGTGNVAHLEENVATVLGSPLPQDDRVRIRRLFGSIAETEWDPK